MNELRAAFPTATDARKARAYLITGGVPADEISLEDIELGLIEQSAREGRTMGRIVVVIALASIVGTAIGAGLGVLLHVLVGPKGTSGLIILIVSWAIFAHLLIGMWAGYFLLADRTEREFRPAQPVTLVIRCANIDADTVRATLRGLGATEIHESASSAL